MARRRNQEQVRRYHDRVAGRYDASYEDVYWRWHDSLTWQHLKSYLPANPGASVLDLGCGTGKWGLKLLKSGYQVTFVDISPAMLNQARRHVEETGAGKRATFWQADLVELSKLPEGVFALAVAFGEPIGCAENPLRALKEIGRRLRPDGVLLATFDNRLAAIEFYLKTADGAALEEFLQTGRTHWLTQNPDERFPIHTYAPGQLRKLFEHSGYQVMDMIGKTVLPMRHFRERLVDAEERRRLARLEQSLCRDPAAMGRAAHLQVAARRSDNVSDDVAGTEGRDR